MKRTQQSSAKPKPPTSKPPASRSRAKSPEATSTRSASKAKPTSAKPTRKSAASRAASQPRRAPAAAPLAAATSTSPASKQSQLIDLLGSGASMAQMMELTGWQPHTVRGMLSGTLRKRLGLNVQHQMEEGVRVYRIVEAQAQ